MPFLLLPSAGTRMDRPVTNSIPSSEGTWDRDSCVFPVPGNSVHAGQQESPSLPAAGRITAQQFVVFANGHSGFWWMPGSA